MIGHRERHRHPASSTHPILVSVAQALYERIYLVVAHIPRARIATYGQIAAIVGDCSARVVGYAMAAIPSQRRLPWHRVMNRQGRVSVRRDGHPDLRQRRLLEAEGVVFDRGGRVDLTAYGWQGPADAWLRRHDMRAPPPPRIR